MAEQSSSLEGAHIDQLMLPNGKLLALVMVFVAIGAVAGSGAFTTVQAERTADITTAGDAEALLAIDAVGSSDFSATNNDGTVDITLDNDAEGADGVNTQAETLDDDVITVTNQGTDEVELTITSPTTNSNATVEFYTTNQGNDGVSNTPNLSDVDAVDLGASSVGPNGRSLINNSAGNAVTLSPGDKLTVGLYINTEGIDTSDNDNIFDDGGEVTIVAENTTDTDTS